ncbi:DUF2809 domain-containing protein [Thiofilum flexile]|uniref:ribosomal maturation YjgA family protein n=1 Tax=Thiofilum flexile TaxID=125627 RepID=UPI00036A7A72|nr:DUF2809 domain-containing protein [Thiofilum flexile]
MRLSWPMLGAAIVLFVVEAIIATRLNHFHFIRAYFGDFLVVILVYCTIQAFWDVNPRRLAIGVFVFSCVIELAQWFQLADILQLSGWARVILGTSFSWVDILMYAAGCITIYGIDSVCRQKTQRTGS